jgi:hypothetical protein
MKIQKQYDIAILPRQTIELPVGAELLSVECKREAMADGIERVSLQMSASVDPAQPTEQREFAVYSGPISHPPKSRHAGTVTPPEAPMTWHVFDLGVKGGTA